jgi:sugar phosphate isomerase/epimerase
MIVPNNAFGVPRRGGFALRRPPEGRLRASAFSVAAFLILCVFAIPGMMATDAPPPFFAFDNGVGRGKWPVAQQIVTLKELGWDGISYNYTTAAEMAERRAVCKTQGVRLVAMYFFTTLGQPAASDDLQAAIQALKGSGTVLWMTILKPKDHATKAGDDEAVAMVQAISRLARDADLPVSLYPHAGFHVATAADAMRVVRKAREQGCDNVGVTVNLCHEIMGKQGANILATIREAGPLISLASINGADALDVPAAKPIRLLGEGGFAVAGVVKALRAAGYRGPIGHQFYSIPGDPRENLAKAMAAWKTLVAGL